MAHWNCRPPGPGDGAEMPLVSVIGPERAEPADFHCTVAPDGQVKT
jgi:hypothetical protein